MKKERSRVSKSLRHDLIDPSSTGAHAQDHRRRHADRICECRPGGTHRRRLMPTEAETGGEDRRTASRSAGPRQARPVRRRCGALASA
jgi:hypothetical protein